MKKRDFRSIVVLSFLTIFTCACSGSPQEETATNDETAYLDPVEVASDHYTLLSEDGDVRVIEMYLPAGEQDNEHSHNWETVYFISGGSAGISVGDEVMEAEIPDGHVMYHGPWTHSVENLGDTDIHAIIVEQMVDDLSIEPYDDYIDATEASPDHYILLSQEGNVRVIYMKLEPGDRDETHSHYYETVYFLSGGHANIHVGEEVVDAEIPDGYVMHHDTWTHSVENVGDTPIEAIIVEILPNIEDEN